MSALDELDELARRTLVWKSLGRCAYCLRRDYEWEGWRDPVQQNAAHPDYLACEAVFPFPTASYLCPSCRAPVRAWWAAFQSPARAA